MMDREVQNNELFTEMMIGQLMATESGNSNAKKYFKKKIPDLS